MQSGTWTSLEIAKLAAGLLTPIALAALGIYLHRVAKRFEHLQWRSQKLIEKRLAVYDSLAPKLNDLFCYFTYVGNWRDVSPLSVVALKRSIDKEIYLAAPLFRIEFFKALTTFQDTCFETFTGWGHDACLRTDFARRQEHFPGSWDSEWSGLFTDNVSTTASVRLVYSHAMRAFSKDIGVHEQVEASEC
jgi:hypothetical protein